MAAMLLGLIPLVATAAPAGTAITSAAELQAMSASGTYYLANDITISGNWDYATPFAGTLDGDGHTIYIADGTTLAGGLFRELKNPTIKNLKIVQKGNATYNTAYSNTLKATIEGTGVLAALAYGDDKSSPVCTITDVYIYANLNATHGKNVGGFIGEVRYGALQMTRCVFDGSITATGGTDNFGVGGMVGGTWQRSYSFNIQECINYATIKADAVAGGIFGTNRVGGYSGDGAANCLRNTRFEYCINYGDVTTTASEYAGGIFGTYKMNDYAVQIRFRNNINFGTVTNAAAAVSGKNRCAGGIGGGFRGTSTSGTTSQLMGNINYGTAIGSWTSNMVANPWTGSIATRQLNYCGTEFGSGYGSTKITDASAVVSSLNSAGFDGSRPRIYSLLPNGKITLTWAKERGYGAETVGSAKTTFVGAQLSGTGADETRNVRFIGGIKAENTDLEKVGIMIIASYGDGQSLTFEGETVDVYETILADGETIHAVDNGVDYFYTAVVSEIPTNIGTVTFKVFAYQLDDGAVVYSNSGVLTIDLTTMPEDYSREGWDIDAPAYEGGTLAAKVYDAGTGIEKDTETEPNNGERSYMMCVSNTSAAEFNAYEEKLTSYGYTLDSQNTLAAGANAGSQPNLYREYRKGSKLIYAYYTAATKEARVIVDNASVAETEFEYSFAANASTQTEIYMYGMKYSTKALAPSDDGGDSSTPNNGAFYIIKQADNSVILIDGGGALQSTDAAKAELWRFLHEITGKGDNETITVAAWIVTHSHEDHFALAYDVLKENRSNIDLQRVMFNFPNPTAGGQGLYEFRGNIDYYFPNAKFLKCHTGQSIRLGSIDVDILLTHEDQVNATTGNSTMQGGNSMTTVMRFVLPDGTVFLNLGDFEEEQQTAFFNSNSGMINKSELVCDIIGVAHHGYNDVADTYKAAKATYALWTNYSHENFPHGIFASNKWRYERAEEMISALNTGAKSAGASSCNIYYAGKNTAKLACVNGNITVTLTNPVY